VTHYVADVEALLVDAAGIPDENALEHFRRQLRAYGFDWSHKDIYERTDGFLAPHLSPALFRETELGRLKLEHFARGRIPETVRSIAYSLEVMAPALSASESNRVLDLLLKVT
jgi:hypothetical protein